jgi:hypothetical protein
VVRIVITVLIALTLLAVWADIASPLWAEIEAALGEAAVRFAP